MKTSQSTAKQEVMIEKEFLNLKNQNKEDSSNKKEKYFYQKFYYSLQIMELVNLRLEK